MKQFQLSVPRAEHKLHSADCAFAKKGKPQAELTVEEFFKMEIASQQNRVVSANMFSHIQSRMHWLPTGSSDWLHWYNYIGTIVQLNELINISQCFHTVLQ